MIIFKLSSKSIFQDLLSSEKAFLLGRLGKIVSLLSKTCLVMRPVIFTKNKSDLVQLFEQTISSRPASPCLSVQILLRSMKFRVHSMHKSIINSLSIKASVSLTFFIQILYTFQRNQTTELRWKNSMLWKRPSRRLSRNDVSILRWKLGTFELMSTVTLL